MELVGGRSVINAAYPVSLQDQHILKVLGNRQKNNSKHLIQPFGAKINSEDLGHYNSRLIKVLDIFPDVKFTLEMFFKHFTILTKDINIYVQK